MTESETIITVLGIFILVFILGAVIDNDKIARVVIVLGTSLAIGMLAIFIPFSPIT